MADKLINNEENEFYVKFSKPITWEDKEYSGVDMSGLEQLSGRQYCEAVKKFTSAGNIDTMMQMNPNFACIIGSMVTGLPIEFFYDLPARELNAIKNRVSIYFFKEG